MNENGRSARVRAVNTLEWLARLQAHSRERNGTTGEGRDGPDGVGAAMRRRQNLFLDDLIKQLDMVICCQMSVLFYMDCSTWRFALRLIPHWLLSNPPFVRVLAGPVLRQYVTTSLFTSFVCMFLHIAVTPPIGSELSRGYVHNGFPFDFVGEAAPASRSKMLLVDICIVILQLLLAATVLERRGLKTTDVTTTADGETVPVTDIGTQDHDAEERGLRRSQEGQNNPDEVDEPLIPERSMTEQHASDESYSGQMMLLTINPASIVWKARV